MIAQIVQMEKAFWEKYVLGGAEPPADGSEATARFLDEKYQDSNGGSIELPKEALPLCEQYEKISIQLKELGKQKEEAANKIKNYLKGNETGTVGGRKVTWKPVVSTTFDKKGLEKEHKDIYEKYCRKSQRRRLSIA